MSSYGDIQKETLIVCALPIETQNQLEDYDVLYTGVGKVNATLKLARANGDKEMVVGGKKYPVKDVEDAMESNYRPEEVDAYFKVDSMRDALMKVWERAVPKEDAHKDDEEPKKKNDKTMTGKKVDDVKVNMPEKKVGKKDLPQ